MNIRKATINDMDILIQLRLDYLLTDKGNLEEGELKAIRSQLVTYFTKHINNDFIAIFAEIDNHIVSTAFLAIAEKPANPSFITGKTGTLLNVFTYRDYRRRGCATKVISQVIEEAKQLGVSLIELSATPDGEPLYKKFGFVEAATKYTPMKLQLF
ncbi:GNAT family N-acetyltransferase [Petroclostridium sp. X23]|uniref:GNAT family N-acetyltransferase n=1 Tax=Petroclostridium sp. X23 TaxID=3045146 RepID=UPI0024ADA3F8|nr:GNAT family N-acetyltransferase [Petroclostridium sp. X23]WHH60220.1 GNAT family N-acetyltransferase [Petroclostridium sp. X23]